MVLQRLTLFPELWEKRCQTPSKLPVKTILKSKDQKLNIHGSVHRSITQYK